LRQNIDVGIGYVEAWLRGLGCVPLHNLMEDAATAEISRAQVWQWRRHGAKLSDGRTVTQPLIRDIIAEQLAATKQAMGEERYAHSRFDDAAQLFEKLVGRDQLDDFLTVPAYDMVPDDATGAS
jgi:malate synthase